MIDTAEQNKTICIDFLERVHNKNDLSAIDDYVNPNVVSHDPFPGQKPGIDGVKDSLSRQKDQNQPHYC